MSLTRQERIARGRRAGLLLADDDVQEAFRDIDRELFDSWRRNTDLDPRKREALHAQAGAVAIVLSRLVGWRDDGRLAESQTSEYE